jgi:hypothetical protein
LVAAFNAASSSDRKNRQVVRAVPESLCAGTFPVFGHSSTVRCLIRKCAAPSFAVSHSEVGGMLISNYFLSVPAICSHVSPSVLTNSLARVIIPALCSRTPSDGWNWRSEPPQSKTLRNLTISSGRLTGYLAINWTGFTANVTHSNPPNRSIRLLCAIPHIKVLLPGWPRIRLS